MESTAARHGGLPGLYEPPVVAESLYRALVERYGPVVGKVVFEKMYEEHRGPFGAHAKYDPTKRSVAQKIAKAGGIIPDPSARLRAALGRPMPAPRPARRAR